MYAFHIYYLLFYTWTYLPTYSHIYSTRIGSNQSGLSQESDSWEFSDFHNAVMSWGFHYKSKFKSTPHGPSLLPMDPSLPTGPGGPGLSDYFFTTATKPWWTHTFGPGSQFRLLVLLFAQLGLRGFAFNYGFWGLRETNRDTTCECDSLKGDRLTPLSDI